MRPHYDNACGKDHTRKVPVMLLLKMHRQQQRAAAMQPSKLYLTAAALICVGVLYALNEIDADTGDVILDDCVTLDPCDIHRFELGSRSRVAVLLKATDLICAVSFTTYGEPLQHCSRLVKIEDKIDLIKVTNGPLDNRVCITARKLRLEAEHYFAIAVAFVFLIDRQTPIVGAALTFLLLHELYKRGGRPAYGLPQRTIRKYIA